MSDQREPKDNEVTPNAGEAVEPKTRRDFLKSLGRWSAIIIGGAALGGIVEPTDAGAWINGGGGAWVNARGGGGVGWVNAGGGGASWINRPTSWINRSGGWINARGGGGSWVNRF